MRSTAQPEASVQSIVERFLNVRGFTERICEPLETEDYVVQTMPDVSPTRWHLGHTTWFFETFLLGPHVAGYQLHDDAFEYLFNSYYNTVGQPFPRSDRGLLSRPTVSEIWEYRRHVDVILVDLLSGDISNEIIGIVELGLQHEQQHQELMLTDIKHVFSQNPLFPIYRSCEDRPDRVTDTASSWVRFDGGIHEFGAAGTQFCFDNERPRFESLLPDFELQDRLVINREYKNFMDEGGYRRPEFWLSLGWSTRVSQDWDSPLHWVRRDGDWYEFTLHGLVPVDLDAPVSHISYFEADAFSRWSGRRLPTELEWEHAAGRTAMRGHFVESGLLQPTSAAPSPGSGARQLYGDLWEWTSSPYTAYPGYCPEPGALGEYNGKFMCNQFVLRGGSCVTPQSHIRATYRNFFPPEARWQFSGIRLAR